MRGAVCCDFGLVVKSNVLETGNWKLETGNWQLATGNWRLATTSEARKLRQFDRRWKRGWPTMFGGLFVGVGETDQLRLAPGAADEGEPDWESVNEAGGNGHTRIPCHRGRRRTGAQKMIAVDE